MQELLDAIREILDAEEYAITVRHLFYRLVGESVIPKTEQAYKALVGHLSRWRRSRDVPWNSFADSTRWHIKAPTFDSLDDALQRTRETYRRDMWSTQRHYVETWVEKDAIASIVSDVAGHFGVPVFVARGFASLSSLYSAAATFKRAEENGKVVTIFHLGDYDPSGHAAADAIERTLIDDFGCILSFDRIAITRAQIVELDLPTRPTKSTDSRTVNWDGEESVELDSMKPADMRALVETAITKLIDAREWVALKKIEAAERETLEKIRVA